MHIDENMHATKLQFSGCSIMTQHTFFVTGTDTDVGKTYVSNLLLRELTQRGNSTLGFKPISAGCENTPAGLRNEDALILQSASSIKAEYDHINPIAYAPPIAPHIAAELVGQSITLDTLQTHLKALEAYQADVLLIEGAGGWRLPLNRDGVYLSDFAKHNQMPVILVVGMRLGCLNHAVMSYESIVNDGLNCVGWIANQLSDDMPYYNENLASLQSLIKAPLLAEVAHQSKVSDASGGMKCFAAFDEIFSA
jgi:dethiobiotin synthetase